MSETNVNIRLRGLEKIQNNIDAIDRVLTGKKTANDDALLIDIKYILITMREQLQ